MRRGFIRAHPLQAVKLTALLATVVFAIGGFLRLFPAPASNHPLLFDTQFLALLLVPLLSLGLVLVVTVETLVTGYRAIQTDTRLFEQLSARPVYWVIRAGEAAIALVGTGGLLLAMGALATDPNIPAPAGVGLMLLAFGAGFLIIVASLSRTLAEYFYHQRGR